MKTKNYYVEPCTDEVTIRTEANFVATGGIPSGKTGNSSTEDFSEEDYETGVIWS